MEVPVGQQVTLTCSQNRCPFDFFELIHDGCSRPGSTSIMLSFTPSTTLSSLLLLFGLAAHSADACSCLRPITFESSFANTDVTIRAKVLYEIFPDGKLSNPDDPFAGFLLFRYWEALVETTYRSTCAFSTNFVVIQTGSNSAVVARR